MYQKKQPKTPSKKKSMKKHTKPVGRVVRSLLKDFDLVIDRPDISNAQRSLLSALKEAIEKNKQAVPKSCAQEHSEVSKKFFK